MNLELFKEIVDFIKANPQHWNQRTWHCGTSHCVAGFAQMKMAGLPYCGSQRSLTERQGNWSNPLTSGMEALELEEHESWLFAGHRTIKDFDDVIAAGGVKELFAKEPERQHT